MVSASELRRVAAFSDLPDDQIHWFLSHAQETFLQAGDTFVRQGDPPDWLFVFLEGLFQWRGEFGGDTVVLPARAGDVSGVFPFSRMKQFTVTGRALTEGRLLKFPASLLAELVRKMPELSRRLVGMMSDRIREGTRIEQQHDRLVSLGKLSAGLAHELNNPASAAKRAVAQLRETLARIRDASRELWRRDLSDVQKLEIESLEASLMRTDLAAPNGLALTDLEDRLDSVLRSHGHEDSWELSAPLARSNLQPEELESLLSNIDVVSAHAALARMAASAELASLLNEIESSTSRIFVMVTALSTKQPNRMAVFQ